MFLIKRELFSISFHSLVFTVEGLNWDWRSWCFCYPLSPPPPSMMSVMHHCRLMPTRWGSWDYQVRVLPFVLYPSLKVFTRCVVAALAPLQARGVKVLQFLDDWLGCAPSQAWVVLDASRFLTHAARLGLRSQLPNSCLVSDVDDILHLLLMSWFSPADTARCSLPELLQGSRVTLLIFALDMH